MAIWYRHCMKSVRIRSNSGPHSPAFGLNTGRYSVPYSVRMWENAYQNNSQYGRVLRSQMLMYPQYIQNYKNDQAVFLIKTNTFYVMNTTETHKVESSKCCFSYSKRQNLSQKKYLQMQLYIYIMTAIQNFIKIFKCTYI